jgi:hypothetical protein
VSGRHRARSNIITAVVWITRTAAVVFLIIAALIIYLHVTRSG